MLTASSKTGAAMSKSFLIFIILLFCNSVFTDETNRQPGESKQPKHPAGFFEWLFGPPVTKSNNDRVDTPTNAPIIFHQVSRTKNNSSNSRPNSHSSDQDHYDDDHLRRSEVHLYQSPTFSTGETLATATTTTTSSIQISNSSSPEQVSSPTQQRRILLPKPRPRNVKRSLPTSSLITDQSQYFPGNNFRQIQTADIHHAIGTELNEADEAIDRFEKNLTSNKEGKKRKRATNSKFRQLNIPYGSDDGLHSASSNKLSKRQLLISPVEQQMYAQQQLAAASMLQQQQLLNPYGRNRYSNRYIDDYYDDDSSYEDSDEYYDHFNRNGLLPIVQAMRHGVRIPPPIHHPYGIYRRSLNTDEVDRIGKDVAISSQMTKQGKAGGGGGNWGKTSSPKVRQQESSSLQNFGPISKGGRWGTIEDYDLSSDFNKLARRKGGMASPSRDGVNDRFEGERHKGLDEEAEDEEEEYMNGEKALNLLQSTEKGRSSLGLGKERQQNENVNSTTTTVIPGTAEITDIPPVPAPESNNATESPTSEEEIEGEEETTTSIPSSSNSTTSTSTDPQEETTSATTTTTTTTSKPRPPEPATNLPPYHQTLNCRCGMQSVRGHDVGYDTVVRAMVNPWLVAVRSKGRHLCSGSIINNKYILTSKDCVHGVKGLIATAGLGSGIPKNFTVIRVNEHGTRNIALLKVKPAITPNFAMRPVCLPIRYKQDTDDEEEKSTLGTGILVTFKKSFPNGSPGLQLVQTEVPMLSRSKCSNSAGGGRSGSICPGPPATMKCGGDPGGILQVYHKGYSYEQIGVVSTTVGCRANKTPGVYSDIRKSVKWILYNTKDARYCRKPKVTPQDLMNTKKVEFEEEFEENDEEWRSDEQEEEVRWARSHN